MSYGSNYIPNEFIQALGWTILHSLWQILLTAILLMALYIIFKHKASTFKYNLSVSAMLFIVVISITTFLIEYNDIKEKNNTEKAGITILAMDSPTIRTEHPEAAPENQPFIEQFKVFYNKNIKIVVIAWYLGVLLLFLKLLGGIVYTQKLRKNKNFPLGFEWQDIFNKLIESVEIKKTVKILESALVKIPVVIGFLKPVILLPVGVICGLSQSQVEAIIIHELAHIKRNDYIINILQSTIEILFFFHPAIWWISNNIRTERENACDDIVISNGIKPIDLARALTNLEIINIENAQVSVAFTGNKYNLFKRIKRMTTQQKNKMTFKEGIIAISAIIISMLIMSVSAQTTDSRRNTKVLTGKSFEKVISQTIRTNTNYTNPVIAIQELPENNDTILNIYPDKYVCSINGTEYTIVFDENEKVREFFVNGEKIPEKDWNKYDNEIKSVFAILKEHQTKMEEHDMAMKEHDKEMQKHDEEMRMHQEQMRERDKEMREHERQMREHERQMREHEREMRKQNTEVWKQNREVWKQNREMWKHDREMRKHDKKMEIIGELVEEMKKDNLLDKDAISYKIHFSKDCLLINDKKQSQAIFNKYKKLFDEKSKGEFDIETELNVNPNFYNLQLAEVKEIQDKKKLELFEKQEDIIRKQDEVLKKQVEELNIQMEKLKIMEEKMKIKEEQLKKQEQQIKEMEEQLKREHENK